MGNWKITSIDPPKKSGLYIVQRDDLPIVEVAWFFRHQDDTWSLNGMTDEEIRETTENEIGPMRNVALFPCWCDMEMHADVGEEWFYTYTIDEPYAWQELPKPIGEDCPEFDIGSFGNEHKSWKSLGID